MTTEEMNTITALQQQGLGYKKIASMTGLPVNSVKAHCRRHPVEVSASLEEQAFCRGCGKPILVIPQAKPRQFCSDACRMRYWNAHRDEIRHKAIYTFRCPCCGREFQSLGNPHRKYCSRECVANARRKGASADGNG